MELSFIVVVVVTRYDKLILRRQRIMAENHPVTLKSSKIKALSIYTRVILSSIIEYFCYSEAIKSNECLTILQ